jgi:uncharacterized membrane protein
LAFEKAYLSYEKVKHVPYCTNCGTEVTRQALFCPNCGTRQGQRPAPHPEYAADPLAGVSDRTASVLCYIPVFGVIPSIVFLAVQRYRANTKVRFNAFQSVYLFVVFLLMSSVLPPFFWFAFHESGGGLVHLLKAAIIVVWIYLLIKAAQEQSVHLPVIGDLAARSAAEQL